ncbi:MAG: flagellar basal-body rod protein FlgG [Pseudomonadota bacterium]
MQSMSVAATGMMAQQMHVEVISNNIANMTTTGYKRRRPEFQDLLYQGGREAGAASSQDGTIVPSGTQIGLGVKPAAVYQIFDQGEFVSTENNLDIAIQGDGFFVVTLPSGESAYTRSGNFQLSPDGEIVTADGYQLSPGISVPQDALSIAINQEGGVSVLIDGQVDPVELGQLELASFLNPSGLNALGNNLVSETVASGTPTVAAPGTDGIGTLLQGFLESSNVNPVQEITSLITAQRAYDMNSKVISASDEMMATVTQLR